MSVFEKNLYPIFPYLDIMKLLFKRKIMKNLVDWKQESNGKTCLLIAGARRVGKSTVATEFGKAYYRSYVLIDFSSPSSNRIKKLISDGFDSLNELYFEIERIYNTKLYERNSLIIFDEIQLFPLARQLTKHLVADGKYDFLETGSPVTLDKNTKILNPSEERTIQMFPMDFEEFCWATNNDVVFENVKKCYDTKTPLGRYAHESTMKLYRTYMVVGGMPGAVSAYVENNSYLSVEKVKKDILALYLSDSEKLIERRRIRGKRLFRSIPSSLSNQNKIFKVSSIEKKGLFSDYADLVDALDCTFMGNVCYAIGDLDRAIDFYIDELKFKIYMNDTGLLFSASLEIFKGQEEDIYNNIIDGDLSINEGMYFENCVAQELRSHGHSLRFHTFYPKDSKNLHEIDFIISDQKNMVAIEVKSGRVVTNHKSLNYLLANKKKKISNFVVICSKDLRVDSEITYLPIYMTSLL